jgi:hypothetical protein
MADASKRFASAPQNFPEVVEAALAGLGVQSSVQQVAESFGILQEKRHLADYDLSKSFVREEVLAIVERSKATIAAWRIGGSTPSGHAYLLSLLLWRQIKAR